MSLKQTKTLKILNWVYIVSLNGGKATAFGSFSANADTSFRSQVSILRNKFNIPIRDKWVTNLKTKTTYKEYWLGSNGLEKAEKLLISYGLVESETLTAGGR